MIHLNISLFIKPINNNIHSYIGLNIYIYFPNTVSFVKLIKFIKPVSCKADISK